MQKLFKVEYVDIETEKTITRSIAATRLEKVEEAFQRLMEWKGKAGKIVSVEQITGFTKKDLSRKPGTVSKGKFETLQPGE